MRTFQLYLALPLHFCLKWKLRLLIKRINDLCKELFVFFVGNVLKESNKRKVAIIKNFLELEYFEISNSYKY